MPKDDPKLAFLKANLVYNQNQLKACCSQLRSWDTVLKMRILNESIVGVDMALAGILFQKRTADGKKDPL